MKKQLVALVALILSMTTLFSFASCGRETVIVENTTITETTTMVETTTEENVKVEETTVEETVKVEETTVEETTEALEDEKVIVERSMTPFRDRLTSKEKKLYDKIQAEIFSYSEFIIDPINGEYCEEEFENAVKAIREDKPELWLFLSINNKYADEGYAIKMSVRPSYNWRYEIIELEDFEEEYMNSYIDDMNEICDEIISRMPKEATLAEKYEFLAREICNRTIYVDKSENEALYAHETGDRASWAYCYMNGPLLYGEGLCQAYAQAYQYLCNRAGLWCICTSGYDANNVSHAWNLIMLEDGSTYHVDLTWADAEWEDDGFDEAYFLLTQEEIERDHVHTDAAEWAATGK